MSPRGSFIPKKQLTNCQKKTSLKESQSSGVRPRTLCTTDNTESTRGNDLSRTGEKLLEDYDMDGNTDCTQGCQPVPELWRKV